MTTPISLQDLIDASCKQIEYGFQDDNAGIQPYTEAQYVNIASLVVLNTCVVPETCKDWQQ
jgi:hypothetical protein